MRFIVVADTHVRPEGADPGDFPANALLASRHRHVVEVMNRLAPAFVIHLGDVVHPVPGAPDHEEANALAAEAYQDLEAPLYVVPGNHDVGDKPFPWVDAPGTAEDHYRGFETRWGPRHRAFTHGDCRFVCLDTPILGTGSRAEARQWRWLEQTLDEAAGERIFLFGHYPPYLWDPEEPEHYDNLGVRARARLLRLIERHSVEAVFSGHVHRFFHRRHHHTDLYVVPSTGFVRPGYAEFDAVAPEEQFGRDDRAKLGLFVVEVDRTAHVIRPVRTRGRVAGDDPGPVEHRVASGWGVRLGITFRHGWVAPHDLTMGGLDEFTRKRARDDAPVLALWEARIDRVRIPLADLEHPDGGERIRELAAHGVRFTVVVAGVEGVAALPSVEGVERWEVVLAPGTRWDRRQPRPALGSVAVGPIVPYGGSAGGHFVAHGFSPDEPPDVVEGRLGDADEVVVRVKPEAPVWESVAAASVLAETCGRRAVIVVQLPRRGEGTLFDDDAAVANRVVEAEIAARAHPHCTVFLDGFIDHDRGYFPRRGLLDRRGDPRPGFEALVAFAHRASPAGQWRLDRVEAGVRVFADDTCRVVVAERPLPAPSDGGELISLIDERPSRGEVPAGPWFGGAIGDAGSGG